VLDWVGDTHLGYTQCVGLRDDDVDDGIFWCVVRIRKGIWEGL
jgi:hypothetical protein